MRRNYLRVRGEYRLLLIREALKQELPPRARRIPSLLRFALSPPGTTSACAENTNHGGVALKPWGNYLRVRGEYTWSPNCFLYTKELPPRARRIHFPINLATIENGTTSACAENTWCGA